MYQNLRQAGANSTEQTTLPTGLQVGLGVRAGRDRRASSARATCSRARTTSTSRCTATASSQMQMPDGTTGYTRDGSFQVDAHGQLVTNNGYTVQPGITIPAERAERDDRLRRHGQRRRCRARRAAQRSARCRSRASSTRPAWSRKGQNLFAETAASGTPTAGTPGQNGLGTLQPGLRRDLERQRRRGAGRDDPDPARLRAELQGDPDLRPDAAEAGPAVMRTRAPCRRCSRRRPRSRSAGCQSLQRAAARSTSRRPPARARRPQPPRARRQQRRDLPGRRSTGRCSKTTARGWSATRSRCRSSRRSARARSRTSSVDKTGKIGAGVTALPGIAPNSFGRASAPPATSSNTLRRQGQHREQQRLLRHDHRDRDRRAGQRPPADRRREADRRQPQRRRAALLGPGRPARDPAGQHACRRRRSPTCASSTAAAAQQADAQGIGWLARFFLNVLPI